jgi:hypothetical protein
MITADLLTVEDRFEVGGQLLLHPNFSVPDEHWSVRTGTVTVVRPDGERFDTAATFNLSHFNYADPAVSTDKRWRVVVSLPGRTKANVPVGSKIIVVQEIKDALFPKMAG